MFHVMLVLPILAWAGVMAWAVLTVLLCFLICGLTAQMLLCLLCRKRRWLRWIPAAVGVAGLAASLLADLPLDWTVPVFFWSVYAAALLCGWGLAVLADRIWNWIRR